MGRKNHRMLSTMPACARTLETTVHEKVALLVLGTHGCTGLAPLCMGSVTARVVRLAPCPVVTVQTPTTEVTGP